MKASDMIKKLEKMKPDTDVMIYDYSDGKNHSNFEIDNVNNCINYFKGI